MRNILTAAGLSESESAAYEALLAAGISPVSALTEKSGLSRTNLYHALAQLKKRGLVEERAGKKALFEAASPKAVEALIRANVEEAKEAQAQFAAALPNLLSQYALTTEKPVVWFREGVDGLRDAFADIAANAKELRVLPSRWDRTSPELDKMIDHQIQIQKEQGITVRVVAEAQKPNDEVVAAWKQHGMRVRLVTKMPFILPSQILIWNNRVAFTSFRNELLTTVIENEDVTNTMAMIFETLWANSDAA